MEAELFGYAKGAFTGADPRGKVGLVELAHKGTLLLNEIGDLPLGLQVKLLRFLEDGEVWAVGAVKPKRPDVRIIASTNRDLPAMIAAGTFRGISSIGSTSCVWRSRLCASMPRTFRAWSS